MRQHFVQELEAVRQNLIEMGENTVALLAEANRAIAGANGDTAEHASELEAKTDHQHRLIHDQCLSLITLQAPVARDARLVTGILDAIVDLELIGDYGYEIVTLSTLKSGRLPSEVDLVSSAIDAWRSESSDSVDHGATLSIRPRAEALRKECEALYERFSKLVPGSGDATMYVNVLLVCRHLERILRHAVCVADQAAEAAGSTAGITAAG
jgi:phosphate transport system protein